MEMNRHHAAHHATQHTAHMAHAISEEKLETVSGGTGGMDFLFNIQINSILYFSYTDADGRTRNNVGVVTADLGDLTYMVDKCELSCEPLDIFPRTVSMDNIQRFNNSCLFP